MKPSFRILEFKTSDYQLSRMRYSMKAGTIQIASVECMSIYLQDVNYIWLKVDMTLTC